MSENSLLEKTRRINKLLQRSAGYPVDFNEVCKTLGDVLTANAYVASRKGKVLGYALMNDYECDAVQDEVLEEKMFPKHYNDQLLEIHETKPNLTQQTSHCVFSEDINCPYEDRITTIVPINGGGERLGTLVLSRFEDFTDEDLVLAEYSATVVGMEILRSKSEEIEEEARKKPLSNLH